MKITEQNIIEALSHGNNHENAKLRIYNHFKNNPKSDGIDFIKKEYGTGGIIWVFKSSVFNWSFFDDSKLRIRTHGDGIDLTWDEVAKKILELIQQDKYFSSEEKEKYDITDNLIDHSSVSIPVLETVSTQELTPVLGQISMF